MSKPLENILRGYVGEEVESLNEDEREKERKPKGYYKTWEHVSEAIDGLIKKHGRFPKQKEILEISHGLYNSIVNNFGGMRKVAEQKGKSVSRREDGYWTLENTLKECKILVAEFGNLPVQQKLKKVGHPSLTQAIQKHGGMHKIRGMLGLESSERPKNFWNEKKVVAMYQEVTEQLGHPPSTGELGRMGYNGMAWVICNRMGGFNKLKKELGLVGYRRDGHWTKKRTLEACAELVNDHGDLPSQNQLQGIIRRDAKYRGLSTAIGKFGGLRKVRDKLKLKQRAKPDNYWTKKNILKEARELVRELGYLPTSRQLYDLNRSDIAGAISNKYGFSKLRKDLGLELKRLENYWNEKTILKECKEVMKEHSDLPENRKLLKLGYGALATQIVRHGGYPYFRGLLNLEMKQRPQGFWEDEKNTKREARKIMKEMGVRTLPSQIKLCEAGYSCLNAAIQKYHGGFNEFRIKLGEKDVRAKMGSLKKWESFSRIFSDLVHELGYFPGFSDLKRIKKASLATAISHYHGGMKAVKERLGFGDMEGRRLEGLLVRYVGGREE